MTGIVVRIGTMHVDDGKLTGIFVEVPETQLRILDTNLYNKKVVVIEPRGLCPDCGRQE